MTERLAWLTEHALDPSDGPCALWPFPTNSKGYGRIKIGGVTWLAHTYALTIRSGHPGVRPTGMEGCHGPCNNRRCVNHTRWGTHLENNRDKQRDGTEYRGTDRPDNKLSESEVLEMVAAVQAGLSQASAARVYGVSKMTVWAILHGRKWSWLTGITRTSG